jgi:biopolymer transport protein TolR
MAQQHNSRRKRRLMGEINVVPYIDVMLVLLIIFMITAPLLAEGVQGRCEADPAGDDEGRQTHHPQHR